MFEMPANVWEWVVIANLLIGGVFVFIGSLGLLRLNNTMARMHAPSKATTIGIGGVLVASVFYFYQVVDEPYRIFPAQDLLVVFFLFLTAPVSAHFMAKAYLHKHPPQESDLPQPTNGVGWATFKSLKSTHDHP
ncbi:MAG: Na+/H+ antiporter subunit G [Planctomycetaceae bacterium]|nr:Na+/H+ antiporter subunit G [Planctomycetaceae bacterium]